MLCVIMCDFICPYILLCYSRSGTQERKGVHRHSRAHTRFCQFPSMIPATRSSQGASTMTSRYSANSSGTLFSPGCGLCQMYHRLWNIWRHYTFISNNTSQYLQSVWIYQTFSTSWKCLETIGILRYINMWHYYYFTGGGGGGPLPMEAVPHPCEKNKYKKVVCSSGVAAERALHKKGVKIMTNWRKAYLNRNDQSSSCAIIRGKGRQVQAT